MASRRAVAHGHSGAAVSRARARSAAASRLGSVSSSTSSTVITPTTRSLLVDDGEHHEVVVGHRPRDLGQVGVGVHRLGLALGDIGEPRRGVGAQQPDDRGRARQRAGGVEE